MEIEKKFLLYEKGRIFANDKYFKNLFLLRLEVLFFGKRIVQSYLSLKKLDNVVDVSGVEPDFKPTEIRLRKYGNKYFLTFKDENVNCSRNEYEIEVSKGVYFKLLKFRKYYLEKIRFVKKVENFLVEFDYYKKFDLVVCEVEVSSRNGLNDIPEFGKFISGVKRYTNRELARKF